MKVVGITTDNRQVVSELGKLYFEQGIPLSIIFDKCIEKNMQISWLHLYQELLDVKISHKRIIHLLNEHVFESYGKEYRNMVISKLEANVLRQSDEHLQCL